MMRKLCTMVWMLALATLAAGCRHGPRVQTVTSPQTELHRAQSLIQHGDFRRALLVLQRLTFEFAPGQAEAAAARYYLAECYFQTGDRVQAAHDFRKVADEFPASEYAPLALLRAGDANLRLWRRAELDPTYGETALSIYQELAGRYPDTDAAARARPHVRRLQNQFAEKNYKNGLFYLRRRAYDSAIIYFKDVIANYPDATLAPDALLRLVDSYRAIGYKDELQETCAHLHRFYPQATGLAKLPGRHDGLVLTGVDALFGGSFDPVHLGHMVVAETAAEALGGGATVRFMPAREQPFKRAAHQATAEQRAAMLSLAAQGNPRLRVEPVELDLPVPSYTVRTLRALSEREPGNRFTLLLGADAAQDLPGWWEVEALPALADIVVFARPGAAVPRHPLIRRVIEVPAIALSATDVRERVHGGRSIRYLVPDAVREYIGAHGLYR